MLALNHEVGIEGLTIDNTEEANTQALRLYDRHIEGLSAYLYTYAQPVNRYGLELSFPGQLTGETPPYRPMEALNLEQVIDQLCLHFDLR